MKQTRIYGGRIDDLILPDHIADWDVHEYWEEKRFASMRKWLRNDGAGETLLIAGAEHGYMAAVWSRIVENTILVEPSPPFWRNIRMTWEANSLTPPLACVPAFLTDYAGITAPADEVMTADGAWPESAYPDEECPAQEYRYLFEPSHVDQIPCVTIDQLYYCGVEPTAISLDCEGAEVKILPGARQLLEGRDVKCWISVHPDLIERDYHPYTAEDNVHEFMRSLGYYGNMVWKDHEEHWFYRRQS